MMLRSITARQLQEWMIFAELEPFEPERLDMLFASVSQNVVNSRLRGKRSKTYSLDDVLLTFGDTPRAKAKKADWRNMKAIAQALTAAYQAEAEEGKRGV